MRMKLYHTSVGFLLIIFLLIVRKPLSFATIIKTEHGDVIDCVNIYEQPAFRHPLLKNHTIQKTPSHVPNGWSGTSTTDEEQKTKELERLGFRQVCPDGTIPVRRNTVINNITAARGGSPLRVQAEALPGDDVPNTQFAAVGVAQKTTFLAAKTWTLVYKPECGPDQSSASQIWLSDGDDARTRNLITAGWSVNPSLYGDDRIHFTTSWAGDGYSTGCYDLRCPGFVQVDRSVTLGGVLPVVSVPGGQRVAIILNIFQDQKTKNWWLYFEESNIPIGYWPKELFSHFQNGATRLEFGGRVVGQPSPPMGSGFLPNGKHDDSHVGYFTHIEYTDGANIGRRILGKDTRIFLNNCGNKYGLEFYQDHNGEGSNFLYGGPGGQC